MSEERRYEITPRDLSADYDESKLDRVGKPIDVELRDAGKPEHANRESVKARHTLCDMAQDFEFFTTGVIYAASRFDRDPISEFARLEPTSLNEELPVCIDYTEPFFQGLGVRLVSGIPVNLDNRLYAIVRHRWEKLRNMISSIAMIHRPSAYYAKLNFYELTIVDPFALKKMAVVDSLPTITVTVFGVSSNRALSYLQATSYPTLPFLVRDAASPEIELEGSRVLGPPPAPETLLPQGRPQ